MECIIFTGPSLSHEDARSIYPDADYRPPIACGDLLRALEHKPKRVAIIDGFFHYQAAVWHKEILFALEQGVAVYGAASMGALRAAELYQFGMVGVGDIFEWYKSGELNDDDEVAIIHAGAKAGYRPLSDAMVNIRSTIRHAVTQGMLNEALAHELIQIAKSLYYPERKLSAILELEKYAPIKESLLYIDKKRADAIRLVQLLANHQDSLVPKVGVCNHTSLLLHLATHIAHHPK